MVGAMPRSMRAHWSVLSALFVTIVTAAPGCEEDEHESEGPASGAVCKEDSTLTWESFGQKFMTDYCTSCHASSLAGAARKGAPSDHNFESAALVRGQIEHIDEQSAAGPDSVNTEMPIGAPTPTEAERLLLGEWLACGAP
jgi:mono/diheme cytochrome c family protein